MATGSIWDNRQDVQDHPVVMRAIDTVRTKLQNGMAACYVDCDLTRQDLDDGKVVQEQLQEMMRLPGRFLVMPQVSARVESIQQSNLCLLQIFYLVVPCNCVTCLFV